jgi:hypothetical protein
MPYKLSNPLCITKLILYISTEANHPFLFEKVSPDFKDTIDEFAIQAVTKNLNIKQTPNGSSQTVRTTDGSSKGKTKVATGFKLTTSTTFDARCLHGFERFGNYFFCGSSKLVVLDFSCEKTFENLKVIGDGFLSGGCDSLKKVDLSGFVNVEQIGNYFMSSSRDAFTASSQHFSQLEELKFPTKNKMEKLRSIGRNFLSDICVKNNKFFELDFGAFQEVRRIGDKFCFNFQNLKQVKGLEKWNKIETVGRYFLSSTEIEEIDLAGFAESPSFEIVPDFFLELNWGLTTIHNLEKFLPKIKIIANSAFCGLKVKTLKIPAMPKLHGFGERLFDQCHDLEVLDMSEMLVGNNVFGKVIWKANVVEWSGIEIPRDDICYCGGSLELEGCVSLTKLIVSQKDVEDGNPQNFLNYSMRQRAKLGKNFKTKDADDVLRVFVV